jgi:hypothetical protein
MFESLSHLGFIRKRFGQRAPFIDEGDLLAAKWPGCDHELSGIVITRNECQCRRTRGCRNLLPWLRMMVAEANGQRERIPDPDEPSITLHSLFSRVGSVLWIGTQAREQLLLKRALLRQVALDGLGVFWEIVGRIVAPVESSAME